MGWHRVRDNVLNDVRVPLGGQIAVEVVLYAQRNSDRIPAVGSSEEK